MLSDISCFGSSLDFSLNFSVRIFVADLISLSSSFVVIFVLCAIRMPYGHVPLSRWIFMISCAGYFRGIHFPSASFRQCLLPADRCFRRWRWANIMSIRAYTDFSIISIPYRATKVSVYVSVIRRLSMCSCAARCLFLFYCLLWIDE